MKDIQSPKYAMVIDASRCFDCKACMIACKVENEVPEGFWRNWVRHTGGLIGRRAHFQPGQCMQCDQPSCVEACPVGATYKQENGLVVVNADRCIGCANCVTACPYGARYRNPIMRIADKCDFCRHRLERGEEPACVQTCPAKARTFGDMNDPSSKISRIAKENKLVQVINPRVDTKPRVFYLAGTPLLDWTAEPALPGNVHRPPEFWKSRPGA